MKSLVLAGAMLLIVLVVGQTAFITGQKSSPLVTSQGPTIESVRNLAELVTTNIGVSDVLTAEADGYEGSWLVKGDVLLGIDLMNVKIVDKNEDSRTAVVVLPFPHVVMARVDHERTLTWDVKKVTWIPWRRENSALRDEAMQQAQRLVEHVGNSESSIARAKTQAEQVIENLYQMVGWTVSVRWQ